MARTRPPYAAEFRQQMVELVRAGRTPAELARAAPHLAGYLGHDSHLDSRQRDQVGCLDAP